jgi:mono/diheme cytochrome c family protein
LAIERTGRALTGAVVIAVVAAAAAGCRLDMHDQPKYSAFEESAFFPDGSSARPVIEGTIARGQLRDDTHLYEGRIGGELATEFPFPIDEAAMQRGREMFNAFCSPCHGRTGNGEGLVVQRGYQRPPDLAEERLRTAPAGHVYDVITNGFGGMPDHAAQIRPADRWRIVAYVRALQLSRSATLDDVPAAERGRLEQPPQ